MDACSFGTWSVQVGLTADSASILQIDVSGCSTIGEVKMLIAPLCGTPQRYQRLMVDTAAGGELCDDDAVEPSPRQLVLLKELPEINSLKTCCETDCAELLSYILDHGPDDPNANYSAHWSDYANVLQYLIEGGKAEMARVVLRNPRFTAVNAKYSTTFGCYGGEYECNDAAVLHLAAGARKDDAELCQLLIRDDRVETNPTSLEGYSALHLAVSQRNPKCCRVLLEADDYEATATDSFGMSALDVAVVCCLPHSEEYFEKRRGCAWNDIRSFLESRQVSMSIVELLLGSGKFTMDAKLTELYDEAKSELEKDRAAHARICSVTARNSSGEVVCVVGIPWGSRCNELMESLSSKCETLGVGKLAPCFVMDERFWDLTRLVAMKYRLLECELFSGKAYGNMDIQIYPLANFRAVSPDDTVEANLDLFGGECLTAFSYMSRRELTLTAIEDGSVLVSASVPDEIQDVTALKFHESEEFQLVLERFPSGAHYFDVVKQQFFTLEGNERVILE